jgi:hypothetical protein
MRKRRRKSSGLMMMNRKILKIIVKVWYDFQKLHSKAGLANICFYFNSASPIRKYYTFVIDIQFM